ncbi:hypothetical protein [Belliella pelovolcani]|uniref:Uncharacterized protein n=1 Tax=Belliella pelovolcani TaxID=529505 RepID=A0A1N7NWP0_9BACT|nr:hypothetical protein [Belliella pelovolcani]SIT02701.1 hypothetical protein SAMN05421761_11235 [Belliella pelovolcani]
MQVKRFTPHTEVEQDLEIQASAERLNLMIESINEKVLPNDLIVIINQSIDELNSLRVEKSKYLKKINHIKKWIINKLEKELKIVPINYYRNQWMALGMAVFGLPFGVMFGVVFKNMAFIGIGIPFGISIGIAMGTGMDTKAKEEGRQLNIEVK